MSSPNTLRFSTLDVFTTTPFKGNQLAVVHVPSSLTLSNDIKQTIAREFNLSETVFLHDAPSESSKQRLDIFTLAQELPFAGHPVIGAICHVCQRTEPPLGGVTLLTKAGPLVGRYNREKSIAEAEIPHDVRIHHASVAGEAVIGCHPHLAEMAESGLYFPVVSIVKGMSFVLINLPSVSPQLEKLEAFRQTKDHDAIVLDEGWGPSFTGMYFYVLLSKSDEGVVKIRTRMLEPSVHEDAATGSAAGTLASYLALNDGNAGKTYHYAIEQGVEMGRASQIDVEVTLDMGGKAVERIVLGGRAVRVSEGAIYLPD
ncbi:hypothetical protein MMC28_000995 [Mycoblastus sanguinarius]|nr:hypothetical protein [Mycoblastus sanguinarius]